VHALPITARGASAHIVEVKGFREWIREYGWDLEKSNGAVSQYAFNFEQWGLEFLSCATM